MAQTDGEAAGHHALHALLLFQMSRLPARLSSNGPLVTLEDQDRSLWDQEMIFDGLQQLEAAKTSADLTRYHFEAGIASLHAQAKDWDETNWTMISRFYELLDDVAPSPAVKVNWAVSLMLSGHLEPAREKLDEAASLNGALELPAFHLARAKLADLLGDKIAARTAREAAKACQASGPVLDHIDRELSLLQ